MTPVEPVRPHKGGSRVTYGVNQHHQIIPLPASVDEDGCVMTEWDLDEDEREKIFMGGRIRLWIDGIVADGRKMCPVMLEVVD